MAKNPWEMGLSAGDAADDGPWNLGLKSEAPAPVKGGLVASAKQAIGSTIQGLGQAAGDFLPGVSKDNAIARYGKSVVEANPTAVTDFASLKENPGTAVAEATGNAGGSIATMLGARALGQGITAAAPFTGPAAPFVAGAGQLISWGGPLVAAALPSYGGIRQRQIQKDPTAEDSVGSKLAAAAGAGAVGAIESKFGPQEWALKAMTKEGRTALAEKFAANSLMGSVAKGAAKGAGIEGAEELAQNPIEQLAAGDNPLTAENLKDTAFSGVMGALGGGVFGAGAGAGFRQAKEQGKPAATPEQSPGQGPIDYTPPPAEEVANLRKAQMGLDPANGPLSAAAGMAVESQTEEEIRLGKAAVIAQGEAQAQQSQADIEALRAQEPGIPYEPVPLASNVDPADQSVQSGSAESAPSGSFSKMDEFAQFLNQERADKQALIADARAAQQAARQAADEYAIERLAEIEQTIADNRQRQSESARVELLHGLLADPSTTNPAERFRSELARQGYRDTSLTPREVSVIQRHGEISSAFKQWTAGPTDGFKRMADAEDLASLVGQERADVERRRAALIRPQSQQEQERPVPRNKVQDALALIANGATMRGRDIVSPSGKVLMKNLNIQQYREARQLLKPAAQTGAQVASPEQPKESSDGNARPDTQAVLPSSPAQGSVDAGGVVDLRPGDRSAAGGQGDSQLPEEAAAGNASAGVDTGNRGVKPLDHGELNIPGRTSNINAQLDRYKAEQAKAAKSKAKEDAAERKSEKAQAKDLLAKHQDAILARHGEKFGNKELRNTLDQWAKWEPKKLISFVNKFVSEQESTQSVSEPKAKQPKPQNLLQLVRQAGGVALDRKADVTGDRNSRETVGVFRNGGMDLDRLAELMQQNGFISDADLADNSGAEKAAEILRDALKGGRPLTMADNEAAMSEAEEAKYRDGVRRRADELGIKWRFRKIEDVEADVMDAEERASLDADSSAYDIERVTGSVQDALDEFDKFYEATPLRGEAAMRAMGFTEEEIREAVQSESAERQNRSIESRGTEASGEADRPQDRGQGQGFLESYSEKDLAERAEAQRLNDEHRAKAEKQADDKEQADADRDSFTLTGSDRDADTMAARGQGGLFDQPPKKESAERFAVGKTLSKDERRQVLSTLTDAYRSKSHQKEERIDARGETYFAYPYAPELFEKSNITGKMVRYYVTLPDGRIAHPTELFPDYTESQVEQELANQEAEARKRADNDADRLRILESRKSTSLNEANRVFNHQNRGRDDYIPAILTDGEQFIRTHPDSVENDLRLLGGEWKERTNNPAKGIAPSHLEPLFADLDSTSTRKANKAKKAAAKLPQAARIDYVQSNFLDILQELEDSGKLKINC